MQKIKASTSQEIKKLRQKMPKNYRKTLQNRTKYSLSTIDKVLSGVYINTKIIEEAIKLKAENQKKIDRIIEKIKD